MPRVGGPVAGSGVGRRPGRAGASGRRAARRVPRPRPPRAGALGPGLGARPWRRSSAPGSIGPSSSTGSPRRRRRSRSASTSAARRARAWYSGPVLAGIGVLARVDRPVRARGGSIPARALPLRVERRLGGFVVRGRSRGRGPRLPAPGPGLPRGRWGPGGRDRSPLVAHSVPARGPAPSAVRRRGPVVVRHRARSPRTQRPHLRPPRTSSRRGRAR